MNTPNDGGPAFPSGKSETPGYENSLPYFQGMTLRAYIATAALKGILSNDDMPSDGLQGDVDMAVAYADCMIRTLERKEDA